MPSRTDFVLPARLDSMTLFILPASGGDNE